jgi:hypothetical protein
MTRAISIMRDATPRAGKPANDAGVMRGTARTKTRHLDARLALVAKELWPTNTAKMLASYSGCGVRTAKRWLSGRTLSLDHFLTLLSGKYGDRFLDAFIADAEPDWWRRRKQIQQLAKLKREQMQHLKRLEQLEIKFAADD